MQLGTLIQYLFFLIPRMLLLNKYKYIINPKDTGVLEILTQIIVTRNLYVVDILTKIIAMQIFPSKI